MKRLLYHLTILLTFAAVLSACEKETPDTTYTFRDNYGMYDQMKKVLADAGYTGYVDFEIAFYFYEYTADKVCVAQRSAKNVSKGTPKKFTANKDAVYVMVQYAYEVKITVNGQTVRDSRFMANVSTLKEGENTDIIINDNTIFRPSAPIK